MSSRSIVLVIWICAVAIPVLPEETNHDIQQGATALLTKFFSSRPGPSEDPSAPLNAWAEEEALAAAEAYEAEIHAGRTTPFIVSSVIFQSNAPWSNTVWIEGGSTSTDLPFPIQQNCPVVVKDTLVGIVDYVGKSASRVRLISDPSVKPAVRVVRGNTEVHQLASSATFLRRSIDTHPELLPKPELATTLSKLLDCVLQTLPADAEVRLAKGEMQGAEYPSSPRLLRGTGFNYDFADDEGPARDLRTGQRSIDDQKTLLIKPGDALETSGLDSIFPRGLRVATVTKVFPLEEGAISYRILANIESSEFPNFDYLTVLPAQPQEPLHPPSSGEAILQLLDQGPS